MNNAKPSIIYPPSSLQGLHILSCSSGYSFDKHLHDGYVLWLNSRSGEYFTVNGNSNILKPGDISIIEPYIIHSNRPYDLKNRHLRSFYFSENFIKKIYNNISEKNISYKLRTSFIQNKYLFTNFVKLHEKILNSFDSFEQEETAIAVFSEFISHCNSSLSPTPLNIDRRINTTTDYLHENLEKQISLSDLSLLANCTEFHLIRLFKKYKNISPHAFLLQLRLEKARSLLDTGLPIADAALQTGLCDQSHLTRVFKKRYGLTPGQYLKQRQSR